MDIKYKIMSALSEPYRIRHGFGLSPVRNNRELKALIRFCQDELDRATVEQLADKVNKHLEIFYYTIKLYEEQGNYSFEGVKYDGVTYLSIYDFINQHIDYYWN